MGNIETKTLDKPASLKQIWAIAVGGTALATLLVFNQFQVNEERSRKAREAYAERILASEPVDAKAEITIPFGEYACWKTDIEPGMTRNSPNRLVRTRDFGDTVFSNLNGHEVRTNCADYWRSKGIRPTTR